MPTKQEILLRIDRQPILTFGGMVQTKTKKLLKDIVDLIGGGAEIPTYKGNIGLNGQTGNENFAYINTIGEIVSVNYIDTGRYEVIFDNDYFINEDKTFAFASVSPSINNGVHAQYGTTNSITLYTYLDGVLTDSGGYSYLLTIEIYP